jgi:prefoldin alpha subunit
MVDERELQEKMLTYRILESRLEALIKQRDMVATKLVEIQSTINSIEESQKSDEILFNMGSDVFAPGKIIDKNRIIVEVGASVAMEKSVDETKEVLQKRSNDLQTSLNSVQKDMVQISVALERLGPEIQEMAQGMSGGEMSQAEDGSEAA